MFFFSTKKKHLIAQACDEAFVCVCVCVDNAFFFLPTRQLYLDGWVLKTLTHINEEEKFELEVIGSTSKYIPFILHNTQWKSLVTPKFTNFFTKTIFLSSFFCVVVGNVLNTIPFPPEWPEFFTPVLSTVQRTPLFHIIPNTPLCRPEPVFQPKFQYARRNECTGPKL